MGLIVVVLASAAILGVAYVTYGRLLARLLQLNAKTPTPAVELRDDIDYEPIAPSSLFPQHFSAIAAAGPIVGPILAGLAFGWLPALIWILVGSIFIGGVHDFTSLVASVRHKARSIAEVVRDLHRNAGQPDQSFSERQIYEQAMDRLAAELAAIDRTDKPAATEKLLNHLNAA